MGLAVGSFMTSIFSCASWEKRLGGGGVEV